MDPADSTLRVFLPSVSSSVVAVHRTGTLQKREGRMDATPTPPSSRLSRQRAVLILGLLVATALAFYHVKVSPLVALGGGAQEETEVYVEYRNPPAAASASASAPSPSSWSDIWQKKGAAGKNDPLHVMNGFSQVDEAQWRKLVCTLAANVTRIKYDTALHVAELGCGAGAFLRTLQTCDGVHIANENIYALDYSSSLVEQARKVFGHPSHFFVGDMAKDFLTPNAFELVVSFSTFFYLEDLNHVRRVLNQMERYRRKPNGVILITDISDADKKELALKIRAESAYYNSHQPKSSAVTPPHLYIPKSFFAGEFARLGLRHSCVDESTLSLEFYEPSQYRYTCIAWQESEYSSSSSSSSPSSTMELPPPHKFTVPEKRDVQGPSLSKLTSPFCTGQPTYSEIVVRKVCMTSERTSEWVAKSARPCRECSSGLPLLDAALHDCVLEEFAVPHDFCASAGVEELHPLYADCKVDCSVFKASKRNVLTSLLFEPRHIDLGEHIHHSSRPSFAFYMFDGAQKNLVDQHAGPVIAEFAKDRYIHFSFTKYNTVAMNTFPNLVSLLTGFSPPDVTVDVPRHNNPPLFDQGPFPRVYGCTKEYRDFHICTTPALQDRWKPVFQNESVSLYARFAGTHIRSYELMWDVPDGEFISSALFRMGKGDAFFPEHIGTGPFARPSGYGTDMCTDMTIQRATWKSRRCFAQMQLMNLQLDFSLAFHRRYAHVPTFTFDLFYDTHDNVDALPLLRPGFEEYMRAFPHKNMLFMAFTSDHGPHTHGNADKPLHHNIALHFLVPKEFGEKHPKELELIRAASMTEANHRDLYWTSLDIDALLTGSPRPEIPGHSRSFIREYDPSIKRTCASANIPSDYCGWQQ